MGRNDRRSAVIPFERSRICTGPAHTEPTSLPLTEEHWYFHKSGPQLGKPASRCRLCQNWAKVVNKEGPHGYIQVNQSLIEFASELLERCGSYTLRHRHRLRAETVRSIAAGRHLRIQKRTAQRILFALGEQRKLDRQHGMNKRRLHAIHRHAIVESQMTRDYGF